LGRNPFCEGRREIGFAYQSSTLKIAEETT